MKTLNAIVTVTFFAATAAFAHEGQEHMAGGGLFGLPPEYIHVLLNPLPVYGLLMGILALVGALLWRNKTARIIGLGLIFIATASIWPVEHFGENAYKEIRGRADVAGVTALDEHMERAEKWSWLFYTTAFLALVGVVSEKKFPKAATPLALTTCLFAIAALTAGGWISKAGGQIRHPEFRAIESHHAETNSETTNKLSL
ncbi:MAG: hypothetical protein ABI042_17995 [Verrucomicrobiota bacterium]